ncbi:MAG: hypothetical protein J6V29_01020 [Bacteroidales bacterium]|nr:hypothetical protein [Bacteroidales bacterium]
MKKILPIFISSLFLLCFWSCSEKGFGDGNCQVTINATIEDLEIDVKSCPTGQYKLYVGIFQNGTQLADPLQFDFHNGQANAVISLVADQTYDLVFWAQGVCASYLVNNLSSITIPVPEILPSTSSEPMTLLAAKQNDAFFAVLKNVNFSGSITQNVTLTRAVGVLNIANVTSPGAISSTEVEYVSYTTYNPLTGEFGGEKSIKQTVKFPERSDFVETETIDGKNCTILLRSYFFTPEKKFREVLITTTENDNTIKETTLTSVPFEQNKKTNLIGNFI